MKTVKTLISLAVLILVLPTVYAQDFRQTGYDSFRSVNTTPTYKQNRNNGMQRSVTQNRTIRNTATNRKRTPEGPTPPGGWKDRDGMNMCWSEITKKWVPHGGKVTVTGGGKVLRVYQCDNGVWKIVYDSYGDGKSDKDAIITK